MPSDTLLSTNEKCGTTNNMTALSIFSAVVSSGLTVTTIPLNLLIISCILRRRRRHFKSVFYKLLLNIAIADLLTGLISDPSSINFDIKEALEINISIIDAYVLHLSVFFAERAERSEAAELICHLSAWCKMYMKFHLHTYRNLKSAVFQLPRHPKILLR